MRRKSERNKNKGIILFLGGKFYLLYFILVECGAEILSVQKRTVQQKRKLCIYSIWYYRKQGASHSDLLGHYSAVFLLWLSPLWLRQDPFFFSNRLEQKLCFVLHLEKPNQKMLCSCVSRGDRARVFVLDGVHLGPPSVLCWGLRIVQTQPNNKDSLYHLLVCPVCSPSIDVFSTAYQCTECSSPPQTGTKKKSRAFITQCFHVIFPVQRHTEMSEERLQSHATCCVIFV